MPDAVRRRPVAAEGDDHLVAAALPDRHRRAGRDREATADDAVGAQVPDGPAGDVHRAATPVAVAVLAPEQLGHHPRGIVALGDGVAMTSVRAHDVVVRLQRRDAADGDPLLAEVGVQVAADVAEAVLLDRALLEAADRQCHPVHREQPVRRHLAHAPSSFIAQYSGTIRPAITSSWIRSTSSPSTLAVIVPSCDASAARPTSTARVSAVADLLADGVRQRAVQHAVRPADPHLVDRPDRRVGTSLRQQAGGLHAHRGHEAHVVAGELEGRQQLLVGGVLVDDHPQRPIAVGPS